MRLGTLSACAASLLLSALAAQPALAQVQEPRSGIAFAKQRSFGGKGLTCVGAGLRTKFAFKVYAGGFYIDAAAAKPGFDRVAAANGLLASGRVDIERLKESRPFFRWLVDTDVARAIDMQFLREVDAEKIYEAYAEGLKKTIPDFGAADVKADLDKFFAAMKVTIQKGQHIVISTAPGGEITLEVAGKRTTLHSAKLTRAVWAIWFLDKPVQPALREGLLSQFSL
jgi:hypothetical protein